MLLNTAELEIREITTSELIIFWLFVSVFLLYLFTFIMLMILPSVLSDYRVPKAILVFCSIVAVALIYLLLHELINQYVVLAVMIFYIIGYITGVLIIRHKNKEVEKSAQKQIDEKASQYGARLEEMWARGIARNEERVRNFVKNKANENTQDPWAETAAAIEKSWTKTAENIQSDRRAHGEEKNKK